MSKHGKHREPEKRVHVNRYQGDSKAGKPVGQAPSGPVDVDALINRIRDEEADGRGHRNHGKKPAQQKKRPGGFGDLIEVDYRVGPTSALARQPASVPETAALKPQAPTEPRVEERMGLEVGCVYRDSWPPIITAPVAPTLEPPRVKAVTDFTGVRRELRNLIRDGLRTRHIDRAIELAEKLDASDEENKKLLQTIARDDKLGSLQQRAQAILTLRGVSWELGRVNVVQSTWCGDRAVAAETRTSSSMSWEQQFEDVMQRFLTAHWVTIDGARNQLVEWAKNPDRRQAVLSRLRKELKESKDDGAQVRIIDVYWELFDKYEISDPKLVPIMDELNMTAPFTLRFKVGELYSAYYDAGQISLWSTGAQEEVKSDLDQARGHIASLEDPEKSHLAGYDLWAMIMSGDEGRRTAALQAMREKVDAIVDGGLWSEQTVYKLAGNYTVAAANGLLGKEDIKALVKFKRAKARDRSRLNTELEAAFDGCSLNPQESVFLDEVLGSR